MRRRAAIALIVASLVLVSGVALLVCKLRPTLPAPPIILITIDTLRADHLSCYGYPRATSPTIDSLAQEGVLFENAFAQRGLTWPSLASIMTSQHVHVHGVRDNWVKLQGDESSLAAQLSDHGYDCMAFVTNTAQQRWNGFTEVVGKDDLPPENDRNATRNALNWLGNQRKGTPFFLWVHYIAPHEPYAPPEPFDTMFLTEGATREDITLEGLYDLSVRGANPSPEVLEHCIAQYDGEIAFIDAEIQKLLARLRELDLFDDSLIVVTSDHGEELFQHNHYHSHYASIYDAVLRIPLVMRLPGASSRGRVSGVVQSIDIAPTILAAVGIEPPSDFQGRDMLPLIRGEQDGARYAFAEWEDKILTVRTEGFRLISNPLEFSPTIGHPKVQPQYRDAAFPIKPVELYDHRSDPEEQVNLAESDGGQAERLSGVLESWAKDQDWRFGAPDSKRELDDETREALEAMGYFR